MPWYWRLDGLGRGGRGPGRRRGLGYLRFRTGIRRFHARPPSCARSWTKPCDGSRLNSRNSESPGRRQPNAARDRARDARDLQARSPSRGRAHAGEPPAERGAGVPSDADRHQQAGRRVDPAPGREPGPGETITTGCSSSAAGRRARNSSAISPRPHPRHEVGRRIAGPSDDLEPPDEQPDAAEEYQVHFKYYQRIEGTLRIPPGGRDGSARCACTNRGRSLQLRHADPYHVVGRQPCSATNPPTPESHRLPDRRRHCYRR